MSNNRSNNKSNDKNPLNANILSYVSKKAKFNNILKLSQKTNGWIYFLNSEGLQKFKLLIEEYALSWQKENLLKSKKEVVHFLGNEGPVWVFQRKKTDQAVSHGGLLDGSDYAWCRDQIGAIVNSFKNFQLENVVIELHETTDDADLGVLVGLDLAAYTYKTADEKKILNDFPQLSIVKKNFANKNNQISKEKILKAKALAEGINWARHLVNVPPNFLNPATLSRWVIQHFQKMSNTKVEVWNVQRLEKEGMGLHLGVGQGGKHSPCLVHIKYRPSGCKKKPVAFVGKGITFDSGGLDLKPSSAMRLMKKDMGGAGSVLGLAHWAISRKYPNSLDFYVALAENSVDANSMRPSDVLTARNGMKVEIHNTDAEGRLVLADALDVAVTKKGKDEPEIVINVATLTGAIKVALGNEIAGLFSNQDFLSENLLKAGQKTGDLVWRMPLYSPYTSSFSSSFADMVNAVDGFGGPITAALFLEKFVKGKPWAHFDIYAWADKISGAMTFAGGNGQGVQCLSRFLEDRI